jgi:hypothetical protein
MSGPSVAVFSCLLALATTGCAPAMPSVQVGPPTPTQFPLTLPPPPEPTPLEAFASRPTAIVAWANPVGRLESSDSRAIVTALALEDRDSEETMRGLRVDLVHLRPPQSCTLRFWSHSVLCGRANAAIFFEEGVLPRVRDGVVRGNAEHNLIISYRSRMRNTERIGLIIGGYQFADRERSELVTLIEQGISQLEGAPD